MKKLDGKVAIITGAGQGIGLATACKFAREGAHVVVCDIQQRAVDAAVDACSALGVRAIGFVVDVTQRGMVDAVVADTLAQLGQIDVLVNNAGITKDNLFLRMKEDDWDEVLNINLKANYSLCKMVIKSMVKKRWGRIINISSAVAKMGNAGQTNYAASKAAIEGFTRSLSLEVASRGITVNAVAPGFIKTEILDSIDPEKLETMAKNIPVGRIGDVKDISSIVSFLASDESSYITGQVLHVNGGLTL